MLLQLQVWGLYLLQESGGVSFDPISMWKVMGWPAKCVVIGLFLMSAYSIGVMIDRFMAYNAARKQSRQFAPAVAGALREGKLDEAVKIADRFKKSHLAKVVVAGLQEFQAHQQVEKSETADVERQRREIQQFLIVLKDQPTSPPK